LRYTELLEKRIAQLESAIETSARLFPQLSRESNDKNVPPTADPRKSREVEEETPSGRVTQTNSSKVSVNVSGVAYFSIPGISKNNNPRVLG
jgi:hypothetical protein